MDDKKIYEFLTSQGWEENYENDPYVKYYRFRVPTDSGWEFFYLDRATSDAKLCLHSRFFEFRSQFRSIYGVELGGERGALLLKSADMLKFEKTLGRTGNEISEFFPLRFFTENGLVEAVNLIVEIANLRLPKLPATEQLPAAGDSPKKIIEHAEEPHKSVTEDSFDEDIGSQSSDGGADWSMAEIDLAVSDYFTMLAKEASGESLNKAEHNAALRAQLNGRSKGSVEFKHQNISGVLSDLGLPGLRGYKPLRNYQQALRERVIAFMATNSELIEGIFLGYESSLPGKDAFEGFTKVDPPSVSTSNTSGRLRQRLPRKLDFPAIDEKNRALGRKGEEWVRNYEQKRLRDLGFPELANQVDWTSDRIGDGTGYDIQSFNDDGSTRYIEVKTTNAGASTPFYVSQNEVDFSDEAGESYFIYRVFDFSTDPKFYELQGSLNITACLEVTAYRARPMPKTEPTAD